MRGYIYNNPKLAYEDDGFYTFDGKNPHEYWVVLKEMDDDLLFLAPIWFDFMDNLSDSVIDSCPIQISEGIQPFTVGIGRCVHRLKQDITTEPIIFLHPDKCKEICNIIARSLRGE